MKIKTQVKAGALSANRCDTVVKAKEVSKARKRLKVKTEIKASALTLKVGMSNYLCQQRSCHFGIRSGNRMAN